jgi:hypothetical protein
MFLSAAHDLVFRPSLSVFSPLDGPLFRAHYRCIPTTGRAAQAGASFANLAVHTYRFFCSLSKKLAAFSSVLTNLIL